MTPSALESANACLAVAMSMISPLAITGTETAAFTERGPDIVIQPTVTETLNDLPPGFSLKDTVQNLEARYISLALEKSGHRIVQAAALLGMQHQTLSLMLRNRHKDILSQLQQRKKRTRKAGALAPNTTGKSASEQF